MSLTAGQKKTLVISNVRNNTLDASSQSKVNPNDKNMEEGKAKIFFFSKKSLSNGLM